MLYTAVNSMSLGLHSPTGTAHGSPAHIPGMVQGMGTAVSIQPPQGRSATSFFSTSVVLCFERGYNIFLNVKSVCLYFSLHSLKPLI